MLPPTVHVNTFLKENKKPYVDPISQMFIVLQVMFGFGRMPVIGKGKFIYILLTFVLSIILNSVVTYFTVLRVFLYNDPSQKIKITRVIRNIIITLLSFMRCKWLVKYYKELNKFDTEAGCRPKAPKSSIWNAVLAVLMCINIVLIFEIPMGVRFASDDHNQFIPVHMIYVLEVCYFGHLLNILIPRLKLINYYIESSLSSARQELFFLRKEFIYMKLYNANLIQCKMLKLMDLYQIVIEAYDYLIEGIKWQLLVLIISAFETILGFLYVYAMNAIRTGEILSGSSIKQLGVTLVIMIPLFSPCIFSDRVHYEVKQLRELLTSRLYENKLDKPDRSVARALLAFTETRDLSFRLLHMVNIDISLPFKFVGLLVTYLIILLQFQKVISP